MSANKEMNDVFRDRNLQRIGRVLSLPQRADAARQARWQQELPATDSGPGNKKESIMRRYRNFAFVTTGVLAASITLIVWLGLGGTKSVSAETIFANLRAKLGRSLSITIKGIEWDNVAIDGKILIDRAGDIPNDETDTVYSEMYALLKAGSPKWNDLDGVSVLCLSPTRSWHYSRGNGGSGDGSFVVRPAEVLYKGPAWRQNVENWLRHFDVLPQGRYTFSNGKSRVSYGFMGSQRQFVQQLLKYLLDLSNAQTADGLIADLQDAARVTSVEQVGEKTWVLSASDFKRIGSLQPPDPQLPDLPDDIEELFEDTVWELSYSVQDKRLIGQSWYDIPGDLHELGRTIDGEELEEEFEPHLSSPDELVRFLRSRTDQVTVDKSPWYGWKIRVTGYPFPLTVSSDWQWTVKNIPQLLRDVELTVYYNTETDEFDRAEFHNIVSSGSLITLTPGSVDIEPSLLDPDRWATSNTRILTDHSQIETGVIIIRNPLQALIDLFTKPRENLKDDPAGK